MRILGIDPGLTRCGLGLIEAKGRVDLGFLEVTVVRSSPSSPHELRVHAVASAVEEFVERFRPDAIAIERVFAQHNVSTVMGIAHITGAVMLIAGDRSIPVTLYTPTQVKAAVSGYGGADKAQVQQMVMRVLHLDAVPQPADAADALAIAICHAWNASPRAISSPDAAGGETAAQKLWREAESRAGRGR